MRAPSASVSRARRLVQLCVVAAASELAGCRAPAPAPVVPPTRGAVATAAPPVAPLPRAELLTPRYPPHLPYSAPSFSADGGRVATLHEGRAYVVDLRDGPGRTKGDVHGPFADYTWPSLAALSPDGQVLAVAQDTDLGQKSVVVFDVATGAKRFVLRAAERPRFVAGGALQVSLEVPSSHAAVIDRVSGEVLRTFGAGTAYAAADYSFLDEGAALTLWNPATGARLARLGQHAKGRTILGSTTAWIESGAVHAFDLAAARPIPLAEADACRGRSVTIDLAQRTIGAVAGDGDLCLWDVASGALRRLPWKGPRPRSAPSLAAISGTMVSFLVEGRARIVDTTTNTVVTEAEWEAQEPLAVSPDRRLGVSSEPRTVFDLSTGKPVFAFAGERPAFSPDSRTLAFRGPSFGLEVVDVRAPGASILRALPRAVPIESVARTPDGLGLVGVPAYRETGVLLDAKSFAPLRAVEHVEELSALPLASGADQMESVVDSQEPARLRAGPFSRGRTIARGLSPDGKWLAEMIHDWTRPEISQNSFVVLSMTGGPPREVPSPTKYIPASLGVSADGKYLVAKWSGGAPPSFLVWDLDTGKQIPMSQDGKYVVLSPVGHGAVLLGRDIRAIDLASGHAGPSISSGGDHYPHAAFSPDGKLLSVGSARTWASIVDLERGAIRALLEESTAVQPGAFSSDGATIYGRGPDGVGAWRTADGALLWRAYPVGAATLLQGRDGKIELAGDARAGSRALSCTMSAQVVPFAACSDGLVSPGVMERALARPPRPAWR